MYQKNFNKSNLLIFLKEINSEKKQFNFKYSRHFVTNRHLIIKVKNKGKFFSIRLLINDKDETNYFGFKFNLLNEKIAYKIAKKVVKVPKIIYFKKSTIFSRDYLITEWIDGKTVDYLIRNKKNYDIKNITIKIVDELLKFRKIKIIKNKNLLVLNVNKLKKNLIEKINTKVFSRYFKSKKKLIEEIKKYKFKTSNKGYIFYDQHPKNIINKGNDYFFFDFDYFHYGFLESEYISIFLDLIASYSKNKIEDITFIRSYLLKKDITLKNEYFFVLAHYINAIIKHEIKIEKNAKTKIRIYVRAIKKIILTKKVVYPKIIWR